MYKPPKWFLLMRCYHSKGKGAIPTNQCRPHIGTPAKICGKSQTNAGGNVPLQQ
jgi:hypothetical protein